MKPEHGAASNGRPRLLLRRLCEVDWTSVFFIIVLGIATAAVQKQKPAMRPVFTTDATIALPHAPRNSVAFWLAIALPAVVLLVTAALLELVVLRRRGHQSLRAGLFSLLNVVLTLLASLAVTGFITELFKRLAGRLRPDFLARCQPTDAAAGVADVACATPWGPLLADGRMSFPSGHSSCSMVVGVFAALYIFWTLHWRTGADLLSPAGPAPQQQQGRSSSSSTTTTANGSGWSVGRWAVQELTRLTVLLVVLFELAWPWGVALSRFIDSRHNVSDVVAGLLLGACFAPLFVARLATHVSGWAAVRAAEEAGEEGEQQDRATSNGNGHIGLTAIV